MKLWLLEQDYNATYDTYDSCVVAAKTYEEARVMLPGCDEYDLERIKDDPEGPRRRYWAPVEHVVCTLIGTAVAGTPQCVKCASFNSG